MKVYLKIYESLQGKIITLCDENLINKVLKSNDISFQINEFYKGELTEPSTIKNKLKEILDEIVCIHAIGETSIDILEEVGILKEEDKKNIQYINKVPILLIFYV